MKDVKETLENLLYSTNRFSEEQCEQLTESIISGLNSEGLTIVSKKLYSLLHKHDFLTPEFFETPQLLLEVMNELLVNDHEYVKEIDMYGTGTFLDFECYDTDFVREKLSRLINDFKGYLNFNRGHFFTYDDTEISINSLQFIHASTFPEHEITWNENEGKFQIK